MEQNSMHHLLSSVDGCYERSLAARLSYNYLRPSDCLLSDPTHQHQHVSAYGSPGTAHCERSYCNLSNSPHKPIPYDLKSATNIDRTSCYMSNYPFKDSSTDKILYSQVMNSADSPLKIQCPLCGSQLSFEYFPMISTCCHRFCYPCLKAYASAENSKPVCPVCAIPFDWMEINSKLTNFQPDHVYRQPKEYLSNQDPSQLNFSTPYNREKNVRQPIIDSPSMMNFRPHMRGMHDFKPIGYLLPVFGVMTCIAVPAMTIGIPIWVGRKIHSHMSEAAWPTRYLAVIGGVALSTLLTPLLSGLAVVIGGPFFLVFVLGRLPPSLSRQLMAYIFPRALDNPYVDFQIGDFEAFGNASDTGAQFSNRERYQELVYNSALPEPAKGTSLNQALVKTDSRSQMRHLVAPGSKWGNAQSLQRPNDRTNVSNENEYMARRKENDIAHPSTYDYFPTPSEQNKPMQPTSADDLFKSVQQDSRKCQCKVTARCAWLETTLFRGRPTPSQDEAFLRSCRFESVKTTTKQPMEYPSSVEVFGPVPSTSTSKHDQNYRSLSSTSANVTPSRTNLQNQHSNNMF